MRRYEAFFSRSDDLRGDLAGVRETEDPVLAQAEETMAALQKMAPAHRQTRRFPLLLAGGRQPLSQGDLPALREILPDGVDEACFRALRLAKQVRLVPHPRKGDLVRFHVAPRTPVSKAIGETICSPLRDVLEDAQVLYEDGQVVVRGRTAFEEQNPAMLRNLLGGTLVPFWQEMMNAGLVTQVDLEVGGGENFRPVLSAKAYVERLLWLPRILPEDAPSCVDDARAFLGEAFVSVLLGYGEEHLPFLNELVSHRQKTMPGALKGNAAFEGARFRMHILGDDRTEIKQFSLDQYDALRLLGLESDPADGSLLRLPSPLRCDLIRGKKGAFSLQLLRCAFDLTWFAAGVAPWERLEGPGGELRNNGASVPEESVMAPLLESLEAITMALSSIDGQILAEGVCQAGNAFKDCMGKLEKSHGFKLIPSDNFNFLKILNGLVQKEKDDKGDDYAAAFDAKTIFKDIEKKFFSDDDNVRINKDVLESLRMILVFLHNLVEAIVEEHGRFSRKIAEGCRGWGVMAAAPLKKKLRDLARDLQGGEGSSFTLVLEREHAAWLQSFDKVHECKAFVQGVLTFLKEGVSPDLARRALEAVWRSEAETVEGVMSLFQRREAVIPALSPEGSERFSSLETQWRKHVLGLGLDMDALSSEVTLCWPEETKRPGVAGG